MEIYFYKGDIWLCEYLGELCEFEILDVSRRHIKYKYGWITAENFNKMCKEKIGVRRKKFGIFSYIEKQ